MKFYVWRLWCSFLILSMFSLGTSCGASEQDVQKESILEVTSWKYIENTPLQEQCIDCESLILDSCIFSYNSRSVAIVQAVEDAEVVSQCPLKMRGPYFDMNLRLITHIAGSKLGANILASGLTGAHGDIISGDLFVMSFRETEKGIVAVKSIKIVDEGMSGFDLVESSDAVDLPNNTEDLSSSIESVFRTPRSTCPGLQDWFDDSTYSNYVFDSTSFCRERVE